MKTAEDLLKDAWEALMRGDLKERDRLCDLATHIINQRIRVKEGGPLSASKDILLDKDWLR